MSGKQKTTRTLALFDVDGTLTVPRQRADENMLTFMKKLREVRTGLYLPSPPKSHSYSFLRCYEPHINFDVP